MKFSADSAGIKWYPGTTKEAIEEGFERLDPTADESLFAYASRNPRSQGWRDAPPEMTLGEGFID